MACILQGSFSLGSWNLDFLFSESTPVISWLLGAHVGGNEGVIVKLLALAGLLGLERGKECGSLISSVSEDVLCSPREQADSLT